MQLPARIGKYELLEFLGGGMSHVYRARDTVIGRIVAVKILTDAGCLDEEVRSRFLAEAQMVGNLSHDNVLHIYDFGEYEPGRPFMVMEFLRGEDLRHAIRNGHTGGLKEKLSIALQVARALQYVHSQKMIHRDIKPDNVHISEAGVVKLVDFGIAKSEGIDQTRAGYVLGTPFYMAPEQVTGRGITDLVDVYAFGVMIFELFTGTKPIAGDTVERIFYSILNEPLDLAPLAASGAPPGLCDLVAQCTAKIPAERVQGFVPICAAIEKILEDLDAPTVSIPVAPPPASRPWLIPLIGLVVVGVAAGAYLALRPGEGSHKPPELPPTLATSTGEMVLVSGGAFQFGENKQPADLPPFYIDKTEVTNAAYNAFCAATHHKPPEGLTQTGPDYPVANVKIDDAQAFAAWAGKRLPTAKEWEKAARGPDGRVFPWGDQPDASRANVQGTALRPANDAAAGGASPYGAINMVGNVWEVVNELTVPSDAAVEHWATLLNPAPKRDDYWYQMRGLSVAEPLLPGAVWDFSTIPAGGKQPLVGFRCVKNP